MSKRYELQFVKTKVYSLRYHETTHKKEVMKNNKHTDNYYCNFKAIVDQINCNYCEETVFWAD